MFIVFSFPSISASLSPLSIRAKPSFFCQPFYLLHPTMASCHNNSLKLAPLLSWSLIVLDLFCIPVHALNIGLQVAGSAVSVSKECSKKCESHFCTVPPFLRYGKYCGLLYSGCPGEKPCDGLDACCMMHDHCVVAKNQGYLSEECSRNLLNCMAKFKNSKVHTFKANKCHVDEVVDVISAVMKAALLAGRYLHKP